MKGIRSTALSATVATPTTLSDLVLPSASRRLLRDLLLIAGASALIAACARVSIPLPWTPVPITGQTFGVLLSGIVLGKRRGALAALLYLAEGAAGLPIFANGAGGIAPFFGPTAGYLFAFPMAAFLVGALAERGWDRKPLTAALALLLGSLLILIIGALALSYFVGTVPLGFAKGFVPFLPGECAKAFAAAVSLPVAWWLADRKE